MGPFKVWALNDANQNPLLDREVVLPSLPQGARLPQFMDSADFFIDYYIGYSGTSLNDIVKNILTSGSATTVGNAFDTSVEPLLKLIRDNSANTLRGHWSEWYNDIPGQYAADEYAYLKYPEGTNEFTTESMTLIKRAVNGALNDTSRFKENIKGALLRMTERMRAENNQYRIPLTSTNAATATTGAVYTIVADAARGIPTTATLTNTPNLMKYEGFGYIITLATTDPEAVDAEKDVRIGIRFFEDSSGKMKWDGTY